MRASVDRQTALALLQQEHESVFALIAQQTAEEMTQPDTIHYGLYSDQTWSFKDLLAHLITYEAHALDALRAWQQGQKHWVTGAMRSPSESIQIHYGGVAERRHMDIQDTIDSWQQTSGDLVAALQALDDSAWTQRAPYDDGDNPTDLGGMLEEILVAPPRPMYRHLPVHVPDPEAYLRALRRG